MNNMKPQDKLDFNGGWSPGEAAHHISKKMTQQTVPDKTKYSRKKKHKNKGEKQIDRQRYERNSIGNAGATPASSTKIHNK